MTYTAFIRGGAIAIAAITSIYLLFFCDGSGVLGDPQEVESSEDHQHATTLDSIMAYPDSDDERPFVTPRCDICMERRKDSVLGCGHCFCAQCLRRILKKRQSEDACATCPTCRRTFRTFSTLHL